MSDDGFMRDYDAYVMCSTLNQVVNYIPLKLLVNGGKNIKKVINLTQGTNTRFKNKDWDKRLKDIILGEFKGNEIIDCIISVSKIEENQDIIKTRLNGYKKVLFNITGGQRSTILTLNKILDERKDEDCDDTLIYLEGNTHDIIVGYYDTINQNKDNSTRKTIFQSYKPQHKENSKYLIEELTIEKVMKLSGFELYGNSKNEKKNINYLEKNSKGLRGFLKIEKDLQEFINLYKSTKKELRKNDKLPELLNYIDTNKENYLGFKCYEKDDINVLRNFLIAGNKDSETKYKHPVGKKARDIFKNNSTMKKIYNFMLNKPDIKEDKDEEKQYIFGDMLEYIMISELRKTILENEKYKHYFVDLKHSLKIKNDNTGNRNDRHQFCEFDIALLTKAGQLVIFECKSGGMNGEVAKARHFTSYVTGGVYGTPIVITPLFKNEINNLGELKEKNRTTQDNKSNLYDDIVSAVLSAKRARMEVWGVDEIEDKLEELFKNYFNL